MLNQLVGVEREVRRRDHRDPGRARLCRMRGQRARLGGGLRAAMHDDPQRAGCEQDPLAGRAEHQQPVEPAGGVEVQERRDRILVEPVRPPRAAASPPPPRLEAYAIEIEAKSLDEVVDLVRQALQAGVLAI